MSNTSISVIIPAYNCEQYLHQCLRSVTNQTLKNIQVILINDCSNDGSQKIINDYSCNDSRISAITLEKNLGVSTARNIGIEQATGDYLIFLDADDFWTDSSMLEKLHKTACRDHADIVNFGVRLASPEGKLLQVFAGEPRLVDLKQSDDWHFNYCPVRNLLTRELVDRHRIRFDPLLVMGEDALFNVTLLCYASRMTVIDKIYYNYRTNPNSANNSKWNAHKLACTALWFERAIEVIRNSPAYVRRPHLLQELIDERLGMLTSKLAAMALVILDANELRQYIETWARCFSYMDNDFFDQQVFTGGWPTLHRNTVDMVTTKDLEGLAALYLAQVSQCRAALQSN